MRLLVLLLLLVLFSVDGGWALRQRRQTASSLLGGVCRFNTDCASYLMYCSSGRCACTNSAVQFNNICSPMVEPGNTDCTYNQQCNARWPGAFCQSGSCFCPSGYSYADTSDSRVCVLNGGVSCPFPDIQGTTLATLTAINPSGSVSPPSCTVGVGASGCVTGSSTVQFLYDCIAPSGGLTGICCPNRAFICSQAIARGSSPPQGTPITRYGFDKLTGACRAFQFFADAALPNQVNGNNFATADHCRSYCETGCPLGRSQRTGSGVKTQHLCASSTGCESKFSCEQIASDSICCPKSSYICSQNGGLLSTAPGTTSTDFSGFQPRPDYSPDTSFFYYSDSGSGVTGRRCNRFPGGFLGGGGTFNRFASEAECIALCQELCDYGNALRSPNGKNQGCTSNAQCPTTHTCNTNTNANVCCPTTQTICAQSQMIGTCTNYANRFWYNPQTGVCELFQYSGCGGNDNNFRTYGDCSKACSGYGAQPQCVQGTAYTDYSGKFVTSCSAGGVGASSCPVNYECYYDGFLHGCCPVKSYTCQLAMKTGVVCGSSTTRYYFDTQTQTCLSFYYNGCDGNSNNFATKSMCQAYCGVGGCPNGGESAVDAANRQIVCSPSVTCPSGNDCTVITEGLISASRCCPTKTTICQSSPNSGSLCGTTQRQRYFYNRVSGTCDQFSFQGCEATGNNFATRAQCLNYCNSAACANGETVLNDVNTGNPLACSSSSSSSCPKGYACKYDTLNKRSVCCGATNEGVCASNERAYIDALTMSPRNCLPSLTQPCPSPFVCKTDFTLGKYYCCATLDGSYCPSSRAPYFDVVTRQPTSCTINIFNQNCPSGFTCQSSVAGTAQGFCCSANPICPNGAKYDKNTYGNPTTCTVSSSFNECRTGFTCQSNVVGASSSSTGFCCEGSSPSTGVQGGCPDGYVTQVDGNRQIINCNPLQQPNGCSPNYVCQFIAVNQRYQCCGRPAAAASCPAGRQPQLINGIPLSCSAANPYICRTPTFTCQRSTDGRTYACCSSGGGGGVVCTGTDIPYNNGCLPRVPPNSLCQVSQQCSGNSLCIGGRCVCPLGTLLVAQTCQTQTNNNVNIGSPCTLGVTVCGGGSSCVNRVCQCPLAMQNVNNVCQTTSTTPTSPVGTGTIGSPCSPFSPVCSPLGSQCIDSVCACPPSLPLLRDGVCLPYRPTNNSMVMCKSGNPAFLMDGVAEECTTRQPTCSHLKYTCQLAANYVMNVCCFTNDQDVCTTGYTAVLQRGVSPVRCDQGNTMICSQLDTASTCQYSATARAYYCCKPTITTTPPFTSADGCPTGAALRYFDGSILVCSPSPDRCPAPYKCQRSITGTQAYQCCGGTARRT